MCSVIDWTKDEGGKRRIQEINKIPVKHSAMRYSKVGKQISDIFKKTHKERGHFTNCHDKLTQRIEEGNQSQVKRHAITQSIDASKFKSNQIKLQNLGFMKMKQVTERK